MKSNEAFDPRQVFDAVDLARDSGELACVVTRAAVRYQASKAHPGKLERIDEHGIVTIGTFEKGEFVPITGED